MKGRRFSLHCSLFTLFSTVPLAEQQHIYDPRHFSKLAQT